MMRIHNWERHGKKNGTVVDDVLMSDVYLPGELGHVV